MKHARTMRGTAIAMSLAFVLAACGQKPGVHVEGAGGGVAAGGGTTQTGGDTGGDAPFQFPGASGDAGGAVGGDTGGDGGTTDPGTSGPAPTQSQDPAQPAPSQQPTSQPSQPSGQPSQQPSSQPTQQPSSQPTQQPSSQPQFTPQGSDRTGVTADKITLAVHAPETGAAPLPSTAFREQKDLFWKYKIEQKGGNVLGRTQVEVLYRDDKYDPNSARQVCSELASKSFLVVGGGGTDQIQKCGQLANVQKFPYFSPGVTEVGLNNNPWYFAASMTYAQQGVLLGQYVAKNFPGKKVAAVVTQTENFDDAVSSWEAAVQQNGINYYKTLRHPKGDNTWYSSFSGDLAANGVEVVYILSSPVDYIRMADKGADNGYFPQYVGVGISKAINAVLGSGCGKNSIDKGIFFSPFPGLDQAATLAPDYFKAVQTYGLPADDLGLALWSLAKIEDNAFSQYGSTFGNDLTREDFRALTETLTIKTGIFPDIRFSSQNHFGGTAVHVLQADCASGQHKTLETFKSSF